MRSARRSRHPTEGFKFGAGLPHANDARTAACGVDHPVGPLPVELFGDFVRHRFLSLDAVGFFEGRDVVPAVFITGLFGDTPGITDEAVDERDVSTVQLAFVNKRLLHVFGHIDLGGNVGRCRIGRERICSVSGRGNGECRGTEAMRNGDRSRQSARFE